MLATLVSWLNGTREFNTGAALYKHLGKDEKLKTLFAQGQTLYSNFRLQEELRLICKALKRQEKAVETFTAVTETAAEIVKSYTPKKKKRDEIDALVAGINEQVAAIANTLSPPNPGLYAACKHEADMKYKEAMNTRALLFSMVPANKFENPNRPDLVSSRKNLSLAAVRQYNHASELYDRADYVKLHGRLPDQETDNIDDEVAQLENHEVKPALDNARKALSKLRGREQTAERIALIQKHETKIKALEARWLSLKQKN